MQQNNRVMIDNTPENKEKFILQYFGQKVLKHGVYLEEVNKSFNLRHPDFYLELRPLESITLKEIQDIFNPSAFKIMDPFRYGHKGPFSSIEYRIKWDYEDFFTKKVKIKYDSRYIGIYDFEHNFILKELGFLVPYGDLSPKQLIEYGWVKLKNNDK